MVKPYASQRTTKILSGTKIKTTNECHRYLGGAVGTEKFKDTYMEEKFIEWTHQLEVLSKIVAVEPQAAYYAFVTGVKHRVTINFDIRKHLKKMIQVVETRW